jgi:cytochrome bd-type quinol oxidase subunit 2
MSDHSARAWIWRALGLQLAGYVFDAVWHGLLSGGREPQTVAEMVHHLATVHLPLYVGAAGVLVATTSALVAHARRGAIGVALPVAVIGAAVSAGAEAWHAFSHLQLDTHHAPVAGTLSFVGFLGVVVAMWWSRPRRRRREEAERRVA